MKRFLLFLLGCGAAHRVVQAPTPPTNARENAVSASTSASVAAPAENPREAATLLATARRHAKGLEWPDAVADLDRAAVLAPRDPVIRGELAWAALQARDFPKAQAAAEAGLGLTGNSVVGAQLLYNLGRAAQARGDLALARKSYLASLSKRANDEVKAQLASLDPTAPLPAPEALTDTCRDHSTVAAVTRCLDASLTSADPGSPKRAYRAQPLPAAGYVLFDVGPEDIEGALGGSFGNVLLYQVTARGVRPVTTLGTLGATAKNKMSGTLTLKSTTTKTIAGHDIVLIQWSRDEGGYCNGCSGDFSQREERITMCSTTGSCPVQIDVEVEATLTPIGPVDPMHTLDTFAFDIANDGTVTSVRREGAAIDGRGAGGRAKLW